LISYVFRMQLLEAHRTTSRQRQIRAHGATQGYNRANPAGRTERTADDTSRLDIHTAQRSSLDQPATIPLLWGDGTEVLWAENESIMIAGRGTRQKQNARRHADVARNSASATSSRLGMPVAERRGKILYSQMDRPAQTRRAMLRRFTKLIALC